MTKLETQVMLGFSALKMKQEIQEKIYRETKDMTNEETLEHTRKAAERFDKRITEILAKKQQEQATS